MPEPTNNNSGDQTTWRNSLPAEIAGDKNLAKFADVTSVAKGYLELQTKMGENSTAMLQMKDQMGKMVAVPGDGAKPEEIAAYHKAIGVPETPEGYEIPQMPEGVPADPARIKAMTAAAVAAGVPASAMKVLVLADAQYTLQINAAADAESARQREELKKKEGWLGRYDANVETAKRGFKVAGNDALGELLALYNLQDNPVVVEAFFAVGQIMGEKYTPRGDLGGGGGGQADAAVPSLSYPAGK